MPFEIISQNDYLLIKLKGDCIGDDNPTLHHTFSTTMQTTGIKLAVIQCGECGTMGPGFLRGLAQVYKELKTVNGQLRLVSANAQILESIKANGLDRILVNKISLRGALVDLGLMKPKDFDVNFINPFLNATQKVLKIQCFMEAKPQKPHLKKATDPLLLGDISGIISVTSETFSGTMAISLSETIFKKVAHNMLGEECSGITESNVDLVGELANMILGQAKIELATLGYSINMALPSCVWGKDHKIKHFGAGICVVIPFETDLGTFYTEIMTNNNQALKAAASAGGSSPIGGETPPKAA